MLQIGGAVTPTSAVESSISVIAFISKHLPVVTVAIHTPAQRHSIIQSTYDVSDKGGCPEFCARELHEFRRICSHSRGCHKKCHNPRRPWLFGLMCGRDWLHAYVCVVITFADTPCGQLYIGNRLRTTIAHMFSIFPWFSRQKTTKTSTSVAICLCGNLLHFSNIHYNSNSLPSEGKEVGLPFRPPEGRCLRHIIQSL